eukprot:3811561-Pyramimonas_sp.AAC.2
MADSANKNEKERKKNSAVYPQPDGVQPIQITYLKMISKLLALPPSVELPTTVCVIGDKQGTAVQVSLTVEYIPNFAVLQILSDI